MAEIALRVARKGPYSVGDIYYSATYKDWVVILPGDVHFPLTARSKGWTVTGDEGLKDGDASKLTVTPSILAENANATIHGFITAGKWADC